MVMKGSNNMKKISLSVSIGENVVLPVCLDKKSPAALISSDMVSAKKLYKDLLLELQKVKIPVEEIAYTKDKTDIKTFLEAVSALRDNERQIIKELEDKNCSDIEEYNKEYNKSKFKQMVVCISGLNDAMETEYVSSLLSTLHYLIENGGKTGIYSLFIDNDLFNYPTDLTDSIEQHFVVHAPK